MSILSKIIEGLNSVNESNSYEDLPVTSDSRKLQKLISQKLTEKYQKLFKNIGPMGVDIDIYAHKDTDYDIDDVISNLGFSIVFDKMLTPEQVKEVQQICKKYLINYPDFKYEESDNSFWFESEEYEEIVDVMDTITHTDKVNLGKLYTVLDSDKVESYCNAREKEEKLEKKSLEKWFNSQRI